MNANQMTNILVKLNSPPDVLSCVVKRAAASFSLLERNLLQNNTVIGSIQGRQIVPKVLNGILNMTFMN